MFDVQMSLETAILLVVATVSPLLVAVVRRLGPDSWRARLVTVSVVGVLAAVVAVATQQIPTRFASPVASGIVYFAVILTISQAIYAVFSKDLDSVAGMPRRAETADV